MGVELAIGYGLVQLGLGYTAAAATASAVVTVGGPLLLGGGLWAASALLAPETPKAAKSSQTFEGGPRYRIRGRMRLGGTVALPSADGQDLYRVLAACQGPVTGIESLYIAGRLVARDSTDKVMTGPYRSGGSSYAVIDERFGTDSQTVFSRSNSAFGAKWPSSRRGRGVAMLEARYTSPGSTNHAKVYPTGYPELQAVWLAPPIFDMRVAGASFADRNSWVWSDNGVLNLLDHLTGDREDGGWGIPIERFDLVDIAETAWQADALVATRDGTEPRSRCWGAQDLGPTVPLVDTLTAMMLSTGCTILPTQDGLLTIRMVDDDPVPTTAIAWRDIVALSLSTGPASAERPNRFTLKYLSPERDFDLAEADLTDIAWAVHQSEIDAVGEQVSAIELPWCPSPAQAGRIGRRIAALRRAAGGQVSTTLAGMMCMGHEDALIEIAPLGETLPATLTSVRLEGLAATPPVTLTYVETPVLDSWAPSAHEPRPPSTRGTVPDGERTGAPVIKRAAFVRTGYGGSPVWKIRINADVGNAFDDMNVIARIPTGRRYSEWLAWPRYGGSFGGLTVPGTGTNPWVARESAAVNTGLDYEIAAEQVKSVINISDWSDTFALAAGLPSPAPIPATPTPQVLSTDGTTSQVRFQSDWDVAYFIVTDNAGTPALVSAGDADINGTYTVSGLAVGTAYRITAYSSQDVASATLLYAPP